MKHEIIRQGQSDWRIVIGRQASASEVHAGRELARYIRKITGVRLPIIRDAEPVGEHELIVGVNEHTRKKNVNVDLDYLGDEGFIIKTTEDSIVLAGSNVRGTLYAVYTFLDEILGIRWFAPGAARIPQNPSIEVGELDICRVPVLEYREPYSYISFNADWSACNRMNGRFSKLDHNHGGKMDFGPYFVHTFNAFIPVKKYFAAHPEYFSEVNGVRISDQTQLCLTNEEVLDLMIEAVREYIEENPGVKIVSVSQNDCYNPCQCRKCQEIDRAEGSHSGTIIAFVNKVAEAIEKDYPEILIETLAYQYSRKPPKNIRPRHNVIVRLCSIECCFSHPLEICQEPAAFKNRFQSDTSFAEDLISWGKISNRLYVWDYVTNFSNYVMPFPNFGVLKQNIQFFIRNNVKGIFEQGCNVYGGEFQELRTYVLAKLLWNPDSDIDQVIDEFMEFYYGKAAEPIRKYFNMIHEKVKSENIHMSIYDPPIAEYLTKDILSAASELFDEAEQLADDPEILRRVKRARLPVRYVQLAQMSLQTLNRRKMIEEFFQDLRNEGIHEIWEGRTLEKSKMFMEEATLFIPDFIAYKYKG